MTLQRKKIPDIYYDKHQIQKMLNYVHTERQTEQQQQQLFTKPAPSVGILIM